MDNIFGKEDSGNESEHIDVEDKEDKDNTSQISGFKDVESMDVDNMHVKVYFDSFLRFSCHLIPLVFYFDDR